MKNLWDEREAMKYQNDLALRVYTSRLLGREPSLVLHGGGNTSVKIRQQNLIGENELKTQMVRASAPSPSVETILHATLPYKYFARLPLLARSLR
jgi:rhamnose utilization protein RhaD (predicted bifunctional aldolase and dehydrogenase)